MISLREFCARLTNKHPNCNCFFVGGCVRDELLKIKPKDFDVIVQHVPINDLENALRENNVKHDLVGKSFGIIKAKFEEGTIDLALPRTEFSTGDGHREFSVRFDGDISLEEDAKRRDFTINAIYKNVLTNEFIDPLFGIFDLKKRRLTVTSASTFTDDPLRILRAIQFCARFELTPSFSISTVERGKLLSISSERIAIELGKLLLADRPSIGLNLALDYGILKIILPELAVLNRIEQPAKFHNANAYVHTTRVVDSVRPDINMRFSALFHDLGKATTQIIHEGRIAFHGHETESKKIAQKIINRLKLTCIDGFNADKILILIEKHMYDRSYAKASSVRRLVRSVGGIDMFHELVALKVADVLGGGHPYKVGGQLDYLHHACVIMSKTTTKSIKDLAVDGRDIMHEFDLQAGPIIGKILSIMFEGVEDALVKNDYDSLILWFENLFMEGI